MRGSHPIKPWLVVAVWLTGCAWAFWHFELRLQRPFETARAALFDSNLRQTAAENWFRAEVQPKTASPGMTVATVVHLYRAGCPCNRFTDPHLARIAARYRPRHVEFIAIDARGATAHAARPAWFDATPAALVFDAGGHLVYYGPYSDGARCGEGAGLVERALDHLLDGHLPVPQSRFASGCFCGTSNT